MDKEYYRSMVVFPGNSFRQEGFVQGSPFGKKSEMPISSMIEELHVHIENGQTTISLDNPLSGGPVIALCDEKETLLIPGEQVTFNSTEVVVLAKKGNNIQIIFLDGKNGKNPLFQE